MRASLVVVLGALATLGDGAVRDPVPTSPPPASAPSADAPPAAATPPPDDAALLDPRFHDAIRSAASGYPAWGRVDEHPRLGIYGCKSPVGAVLGGTPSRVRLSRAADGSPHGEKLYHLWATDRAGYHANDPIAIGFAIVKESFHADSVTDSPPATEALPAVPDSVPTPICTLEIGGRRLRAGAPTGLFIMAKAGAADAPGTDLGWIYGTTAPDGTVTSAGRVASCMRCHERATHERLFGLR
jgi:hypothetical protein